MVSIPSFPTSERDKAVPSTTTVAEQHYDTIHQESHAQPQTTPLETRLIREPLELPPYDYQEHGARHDVSQELPY